MPKIAFQAETIVAPTEAGLGSALLVHLPKKASAQLPSRGMTLVRGILDKTEFVTALEPDGHGSHWLIVDDDLRARAGIKADESVKLTIEQSNDWPEPDLPDTWQMTLVADEAVLSVWQDITPLARWDWIRWMRGAKQTTTRQRRIEQARSMLLAGKRRPCCFNRTECTFTLN